VNSFWENLLAIASKYITKFVGTRKEGNSLPFRVQGSRQRYLVFILIILLPIFIFFCGNGA
jgi:hypothetical protein